MWKIEPTFVTFIIPTLGRKSLNKAIQSLLNLSDWNWKCIVIFDGVDPIKIDCVDYLNDNHFLVKKVSKKGSAGLVRNEAFQYVTTDWVAFLDDDDFLSPSYLDKLKLYTNYDLVIFSYKDLSTGNVQPPIGMKNLVRCNVGISFAVKKKFIDLGVKFQRDGVEDYSFVRDCSNLGAKYILTGDIQYFVSKRGEWK